MNEPLLESSLAGVERHARGKVRDVYSVDGGLLIVATDRISAFDYILATGIPDKGRVLTQLSVFWFDFLKDLTPTHFLTASVDQYPRRCGLPRPARRPLHAGEAGGHDRHRVRRARIPFRLRLERVSSQRHGVRHPAARRLRESDKLPEPIFTPSTKAQTGHDQNISFETWRRLIGAELAGKLRHRTLAIYERPPSTRPAAASSSPTPSSSSASWVTSWFWRTKC